MNDLKTFVLDHLPLRDFFLARSLKEYIVDAKDSNLMLSEIIKSNKPSLVGRIGVIEAQVLRCFKDLYDSGQSGYWPSSLFSRVSYGKRCKQLINNAGVYPISRESIMEFSHEHMAALSNSDLLGVWSRTYTSIEAEFFDNSCMGLVPQISTCPWVTEDPSEFGYWSNSLDQMKVLVISPFVEEFENQLKVINKIFIGIRFPKAHFIFCKSPLTQGGLNDGMNWMEHLKTMKDKMSKLEFDVALISAGSYALPLAAHAKKMGKIGINCGGELQLFFGVIGGRWDKTGRHNKYKNEYWIRPFYSSRPENWNTIEKGCYW